MKLRYTYLPYLVFLTVISAWCLLILTAPHLAYVGEKGWSDLNYMFFSYPVCHQKPERSFFIFEHKLGVCSRCSGIYFSMLLSTLLYPIIWGIGNRKTPSKWLLIAGMIPIGLDGLTQLVGLRESNNILRVVTGLFFGFILPFYLIPTFNELFLMAERRFLSCKK